MSRLVAPDRGALSAEALAIWDRIDASHGGANRGPSRGPGKGSAPRALALGAKW